MASKGKSVPKHLSSLVDDLILREINPTNFLEGIDHIYARSRALNKRHQTMLVDTVSNVAVEILNVYEFPFLNTENYWHLFKAVVDSAECVLTPKRLEYLKRIAHQIDLDKNYTTFGPETQFVPYYGTTFLNRFCNEGETSHTMFKGLGYLENLADKRGNGPADSILSYDEFMQGHKVISIDQKVIENHISRGKADDFIKTYHVTRVQGLGSPRVTIWTNADGKETQHVIRYPSGDIPSSHSQLFGDIKNIIFS
ncbi:hypothetical protein HQ489_00280 [Candidatus Woesearchaeota archaeon]|nr:hypothetical protein [Candidatus Woesearchaeota archaeon]